MKIKFAIFCLFVGLLTVSLGTAFSAESNQRVKTSVNQGDMERLDHLYNLIQEYKKADMEVSEDLYVQFFELQNQLEPENFPNQSDRGALDQGTDNCPGYIITQPGSGPWTWTDYGTTANFANNCTFRSGRDVVYQISFNHTDSLQITTCGSGFDTYLYIYANACCTGTPVYVSDDSPICGAHSLHSAIRGCFNANTTYYVIVDGFRFASSYGSYQLHISGTGGCGPTEPPQSQCPPNFLVHSESTEEDEGICEFGYTTVCGDRWCGTINAQGDLDVYRITLSTFANLTIRVFGDDTPGHTGYNLGLDPIVNLYPYTCDGPINTNDNNNGEGPDNSIPHGNDSRLVRYCANPGMYGI
jgi:hypothetical protein